MKIAAASAAAPDTSLPKQSQSFSDLKACYRFLNNPRVTPDRIQAVHRDQTRDRCGEHAIVLCAMDTSDIDPAQRKGAKNLGYIGDGGGRGLIQHSAIALSVDGKVLGLLDQRFIVRTELRTDESRTALEHRWRESMLWGEGIERIGHPPSGTRFVVVADRASDCFETMEACERMDAGFLIRAGRDRNVDEHTDKLWSFVEKSAIRSTRAIKIGKQVPKRGQPARKKRDAVLSLRWGSAQLDPPLRSKSSARRVWFVYAREENAPTAEGVEAVDWLLLCSDRVESEEDAHRMLTWYGHRWKIEEWHRALKEGCRLESSQLHDGDAIQCLAAILGVVAIRLLQLRDLAGMSLEAESPHANDPAALKLAVPRVWRQVVATHRDIDAETMTPREFWLSIAKRGGFIGRNGDGNPGWKTIWKGWYDYQQMVEYAEALERRPRCG